MMHIVDRFLLHFGWTVWLISGLWFLLRMIKRKKDVSWLPDLWKHQLLLCGILVALGPLTREAWDVYNGQSLIKAFTDYISWIFGSAVSLWGIYRIGMEVHWAIFDSAVGKYKDIEK